MTALPPDPAPRPRRRRPHRPTPQPPEPPTKLPSLGTWISKLRERHDLARKSAARRLHISEATLKRLEGDIGTPREDVVTSAIRGYGLDFGETRYTRDLAAEPYVLPPLADLRVQTTAPAYLDRLAQHGDHESACAYIDPLWNVVLANTRFTDALPDLDRFGDNFLRWFFHPDPSTPSTSEYIVLDRDNFARQLVATVRAALGRHRESPDGLAMVRELWPSPKFRDLWDNDFTLVYGLHPGQPVHLRDPATGEPYSEKVNLGFVPASTLRFCVGNRGPHSGPPPPRSDGHRPSPPTSPRPTSPRPTSPRGGNAADPNQSRTTGQERHR